MAGTWYWWECCFFSPSGSSCTICLAQLSTIKPSGGGWLHFITTTLPSFLNVPSFFHIHLSGAVLGHIVLISSKFCSLQNSQFFFFSNLGYLTMNIFTSFQFSKYKWAVNSPSVEQFQWGIDFETKVEIYWLPVSYGEQISTWKLPLFDP